ncbi:hypothetical protein [Cohnella fermenti]|uniref:Uncharacterized protein n=1 Tax=Cohnella fermenti TaxID=2565925 RepID=A0A4S4BSS4_9BACL|nr:hypothetical protein [Cohnella fermenti]THF77550.1 hypothetical protein E6C55_16165 [Cohnella fermenti]
MGAVRLYDTPGQFAEMMVRQLSESTGFEIRSKEGEPLLLEVALNSEIHPDGQAEISLHQTYDTYMAGGDLNTAIDYMNKMVRLSAHMREGVDMNKIDPARIYPAIRDERYVKEARRAMQMVSDPVLPGLRIVYMEVHEDYCKIVTEQMLADNPELDVEKVKKLAFDNLKAAGWVEPELRLDSPVRPTCVVQVFNEPPHPIDCQFLIPEWTSRYLPSEYVIAFTNRKTVQILQSTESMNTLHRARDLAVKSRFKDVVERSCRLMPSPVSDRMYWVKAGKARLL